MDYYMNFLNVAGNTLLYNFVIVFLGLCVGWFLYDRVVLRNISLKESLFEKDNVAGWVEFIGAFILPMFYLASRVLSTPKNEDSTWLDLSYSALYVLGYLFCLTFLRLLSGALVKWTAGSDEEGKICLNKEVYQQKNLAAALFSVALTTVFANGISKLSFANGIEFQESLLQLSVVFTLTLICILVYVLVVGKKTWISKEIFIRNNAAAGLSLLGFVLAIQIILRKVILLVNIEYTQMILAAILSLLVFGILSVVFLVIFGKILGIKIDKELHTDNNLGAAFGQSAFFIGIALVVASFIQG